MAGNVEKLVTVNLSEAYKKPVSKRAKYAISLLRALVARHSGPSAGGVAISNSVSSAVSARRSYPLRTIKVKLVPSDGKVKVMLPEEKEKKPEPAKEKKEEAKPAEKAKEEKHVGGERSAPGEKEKTEEDKVKDKEIKEMQKLKK